MAKKNKMTVLFCFKHNSSGLLYSRETPDNLTADEKEKQRANKREAKSKQKRSKKQAKEKHAKTCHLNYRHETDCTQTRSGYVTIGVPKGKPL